MTLRDTLSTKKLMSKLTKIIFKHRLTYFTLILIIILAYFIRAKFAFESPYLTYLSADDYGHCSRSGIKNDGAYTFSEIWNSTYIDAHPIFRNIVLNMILRFTQNIYDVRWISMLPGILLIPSSFLFAKIIYENISIKRKYSNIVALVISSFYAFSIIQVSLSIETRPYPLMMLFQLGSLISFLCFNKLKNIYSLLLFYFFCTLAIITDYSALIPIGTIAFATIIIIINKGIEIKYKKIVLIGSLLLLYITGLQFYHMHMSHGPETTILKRNINLDYIKSQHITNFHDLKNNLTETFGSFFISPDEKYTPQGKTFILIMECLYFLGLIYLIIIRSYLLLFFALFPLIFGVALSYLKLFPFNGGRHSSYFFAHILISYIALFSFLLNHKRKLLAKSIFSLIIISFFFFSGIFKSSSKYVTFITSTLFASVPNSLKESDFMNIIDLIIDKKYQDYYIILPDNLEQHLYIFLNFSKFKTKDTQAALYQYLKDKELKLQDRNFVLLNFRNEEVKDERYSSLSKKDFNKALVISQSSPLHDDRLKLIKGKGFTECIIKVTHEAWEYDELRIN